MKVEKLSRSAVALVSIYAIVYAAFSYVLYRGGHAPTRASPMFSVEDQYLGQAVLLVPMTFLAWALFGGTAHAVARGLGGNGELRETVARLGIAWALPMLVAFVLPDVLVYALLGFDGLAPAMAYYAPVALLAVAIASVFAVRRAHEISTARAAIAAIVGGVVLAAVHGPWLR